VASRGISFSDALPRWEVECKLSSRVRSSASAAADVKTDLGMSGTRVALTALSELRRRGGGVAAVALCGGGGQGDAAILRTL
jgi:acetyl-CoA C-acetyltransferase